MRAGDDLRGLGEILQVHRFHGGAEGVAAVLGVAGCKRQRFDVEQFVKQEVEIAADDELVFHGSALLDPYNGT